MIPTPLNARPLRSNTNLNPSYPKILKQYHVN